MDLLDDDWIAAAGAALADLPEVDGADATIDYVISGAPGGKVTIHAEVASGRVTSFAAGKSADPDLIISMKYDAAAAILTGEATSEAGFMNGALKVEGAHARWLLDLRATRLAAVEALAPVMTDTTV